MSKFKQRLLTTLNWLRIINGDGLLSLTNIAVIVVLAKVAMASELNFAEVGSLLAVIGAYHFKKYTGGKKSAAPTDTGLKEDVEALREQLAEVIASADETRSIASKTALVMGLTKHETDDEG